MTTQADSNSGALPLAEGQSLARWIVCEREGRWAVALRRESADQGERVYETRTIAECWEMLARWPASFVVVELTRSNARALLERMESAGRDFPQARVAVVAERALASCEWWMREAGAVHFVVSPREVAPLARIAVRHLKAAPRRKSSLTERIWAALPWGRGEG
jgi:hypothetical protein